MVEPVTGRVPDPKAAPSEGDARAMERALAYMGLTPGTALESVPVDRVFIGSCTNARLEICARQPRWRAATTSTRARACLVVPGSQQVKADAEREGLDRIFTDAGFEWREPGCSMCLGMNDDILGEGERCASTSNRNFEGRQGRGGRTHLVSPAMAAAAAIEGRFTDVRRWEYPIVTGTQIRQPFHLHRGLVAPLRRNHVDTDQIIPKQFLKRIERSGSGRSVPRLAPHDRRLVRRLVRPESTRAFAGASVLAAGVNFGCGSSREHAAWALVDAGFKVVIAPSFADIFRANAIGNGVLPVTLSEPAVNTILDRAEAGTGYAVDVDLDRCEVRDGLGLQERFSSTPRRVSVCSKAPTRSI